MSCTPCKIYFEKSEDWEAHLELCTKAKVQDLQTNEHLDEAKEDNENDKKSTSLTEAQMVVRKETNSDDQKSKPKNNEGTVKLNYILDELRNMKVAKANAKRPMKAHRIEKDDVNIRYEHNFAVYLALKEELDKMHEGYILVDNNNLVQMVLDRKNNEEDKVENVPKTVIRWNVKDEKNQFESNVTLNLYHTNQGMHFQGGRRNGKVTTCSLVADLFETWVMLVSRDKSERINMIKDAILGMDLRKKTFQTAAKLQVKPVHQPQHFLCDFCPYKSVKSIELKRHLFLLHRNRTNPEAGKLGNAKKKLERNKTNKNNGKVTDAKKRSASPPKTEPPSKKEACKNEKSEEKTEIEEKIDEIECLDCEFACDKETEIDKHMKEKHKGKINFQRFHIKTPEGLIISAEEPTTIAESITTEMLNQALKKVSDDTEKEENSLKQKNEMLTEEVRNLKLMVSTLNDTKMENVDLTKKNADLNEEVNNLKLKLTDLTENLIHERDALKTNKKEMEEVESNYQEAARTVADQQGQITIREEQMKVLSELLKFDDKISLETTTTTNEEDDWAEVYEDETEGGDLLPHKEISSLDLACKKCDKVLKSDNELREHMRKHIQWQNTILQCDHCDHRTKDENELVNHVIDNHSPKHTCNTCTAKFSMKKKLLEHIIRDHGFTFSASTQPQPTMQCHDCNEKFPTKTELFEHKTQKHYKTRLCPFYHGTGRGCRFPTNVCFNIHEESITPSETEILDYRKRIICKNGVTCVFKMRGTCYYKHIEISVDRNQRQQVNSRSIPTQATQIPQSYNLLQTHKCVDCPSEFVSKNDFDHHMKTTHRNNEERSDTYAAILKIGKQIENVFFELKSLTDFPTVAGAQMRA